MRALASLLLALLVASWSGAATAQDRCPVLSLDGPAESQLFAGHIAGFADPDWMVEATDAVGTASDRFVLLDSHIPDFGYTRAKIWLRTCLRNDTADVSDWRLYVHENFLQVFEVYLDHGDGIPEPLVQLGLESVFADRALPDPELIAPFQLAPGQSATLLIGYWSGGSSQIDFSIETKSSYEAAAARKTARNFLFYGMMILLIAVALIALAVFRRPVFLAYAAYATAALLFVMHGDGVGFQLLWPGWPAFNNMATIPLGSGLIVCGAAYARVFLRTRERHPWIDRVLLGLILLTLALDAVLFFIDPQILKRLLVGLSLFSFLSFFFCGLVSYLAGHPEVRFYLLAWSGVVLSAGLMSLRHLFGLEIPQDTVHDSMRAVMVFDAMMMGLAIADRYNQLRRSRQDALHASLSSARRSLDLNARLAELQARYDLARDMARLRDEQIQNVVHDLRQPIHALRLNVMNLSRDTPQSSDEAARIDRTFGYLEGLVTEQLEAQAPALPEVADTGTVGLQEVLAAVEEMFRPDAQAKGLGLRRVPSRLDAPFPALALTRIVSNLVSNAIKYTERGAILIGTRRAGNTIRVEVHDTGPGLTPDTFARAQTRAERLGAEETGIEGKGLGLGIAVDLARRHGAGIELSRLRARGTGLALVIPLERAAQPAAAAQSQ